MCFYKSEETKHNIADKDIVCYKVMHLVDDNSVESFVFPEGKTYKCGDVMIPSEHCDVAEIDSSNYVKGGVIYSYKSYRDVTDYIALLSLCKLERPIALVKCEIPAGTVFWRNKRNWLISEKLVIKSILERHTTKFIYHCQNK